MDKKNFTIGAVLLVAAFAIMIFAPKSPPPARPGTVQTATASEATPGVPGAPAAAPVAATATPGNGLATVSRAAADAVVTTLPNEFIEARLSNLGGAVRDVAFKQYPAIQGEPAPYVFNHEHEDPLLAFTDYPGLGRETPYELVSSSASEVVYRTVLDGRLEVTRRYRLTTAGEAGGDPYRLRHETTFRNLSDATQPLPRAALGIGTAALINAKDNGQYLSIASYNGEDPTYTERGELEGGGIGSLVGAGRAQVSTLEKPGQVVWGAAKNQFFTSIYTPDTPAVALIARRIELPAFPIPTVANIGLTGAMRFDLPALAPNGTHTVGGMLYVGPQEYGRLAKFAQAEDKLLPYTQYFFNRIFLSGYVAPLLNTLLNATHGWVGNWGIAVVIMTLILKIVSLPFTLAASKSAKRMAKLQPLMVEIREKYKDNPQKQQMATMEMFKTHKVNPLGGCIPILITFPLFIGFFAMLQCTAELRFAPFLWAKDLAAPDTVAYIFGFPLNIMPLLMGATMVYQMRLTPTPSVDNMQMKMMKFMPIVFVAVCYHFSCALALYSTVNGIFTILQQVIVNRMKDDDPLPAAAAKTPSGKPPRNVTPAKPKKLK